MTSFKLVFEKGESFSFEEKGLDLDPQSSPTVAPLQAALQGILEKNMIAANN